MKNIIKKQVIVLLFLLFGWTSHSQGATHYQNTNSERGLIQTIVLELFYAIKNSDSENYENLFQEWANILETKKDFKQLLSFKDEAGNNIFHLMAGVPRESHSAVFFQNEIRNLLIFLTVPASLSEYNDYISLGGMTYSEMPQALKSKKGIMSIKSVESFLNVGNKENLTPLQIAQNNRKDNASQFLQYFLDIRNIADNRVVGTTAPLITHPIGGLIVYGVPISIIYNIIGQMTDYHYNPIDIVLIHIALIAAGSATAPLITNGLTYRNRCREAIKKEFSNLLKR